MDSQTSRTLDGVSLGKFSASDPTSESELTRKLLFHFAALQSYTAHLLNTGWLVKSHVGCINNSHCNLIKEKTFSDLKMCHFITFWFWKVVHTHLSICLHYSWRKWITLLLDTSTTLPPQHLNKLHLLWVRINQLLFCASKVPSDILAGSYWTALSHSTHLIPRRWPTGPSSDVLWMTWTRCRSANRLRDCISPSSWCLLEPHILQHQSSLYFPCMIKYWSLHIILNSRSEPKSNQKVENKSILGHLVSANSGSPEGGGWCLLGHLFS